MSETKSISSGKESYVENPHCVVDLPFRPEFTYFDDQSDAHNDDDHDDDDVREAPPENIGEFLYKLSKTRQIEGKKRREAIMKAVNQKRLALNGLDERVKMTPAKTSKPVKSLKHDNICERLYSESKEKIEEGKKRRQSIEAAIKSKTPKPKDYGKVPPSKHDEFYMKNTKYALEKKSRINSIRENLERAVSAEKARAKQLKEQRELKRRQNDAYKKSTFKYPVYA